MSKIMYKDKQILGCISDAKYAAYDNTGTGLSATNAQDAISELIGKLGYKVSSPTLYSEIKIENDALCIRCLKNDNHFYELEANADAIRFYSVVDGVWTELWKK